MDNGGGKNRHGARGAHEQIWGNLEAIVTTADPSRFSGKFEQTNVESMCYNWYK
jgi:hypothetical protein